MTPEIKLEKFQGPLALLLQLIELEKMNITEVSLSEVTEQFILHLDKLEGERSDELADFLVIATKLVYLKSRTLLPYLYPEEDTGPSLADQLKMYQQYVEASQKIEKIWGHNRIAYGRVEPPVKIKEFVLPVNAGVNDLRDSYVKLLARLKPINPLPRVSVDRGITIKQKLQDILSALKNKKKFSFSALLSESQNKTDVIVSFLALLELMRESKAAVQQSDAFGDLEIRAI